MEERSSEREVKYQANILFLKHFKYFYLFVFNTVPRYLKAKYIMD